MKNQASIGGALSAVPEQGNGVAALASHVEGYLTHLVGAADQRDWSGLAAIGTVLADGACAAGDHQLSGVARQLVTAARARSADAQIKRCLMRVIGVAGKAAAARPH